MNDEAVKMWRPLGQDGVLLLHGRTRSYRVDPRGEYIFGLVTDSVMDVRRGGFRERVGAGQVVLWDPTGIHEGASPDGRAWTSRLVVLELGALTKLVCDEEQGPLGHVEFPRPVVADPALASAFLRLHRALDPGHTRLERDERLSAWLTSAIGLSSACPHTPTARIPRDDRALRLALEALADQPERNISLDELAAAAGIGKFRLVRLFREHTGLPPHALQIAHRVRLARRLLEKGEPIADTAVAVGFNDQSHLHRHFKRSLGMTPAQYQQHLRA